jgi:hypothetical protein
METTTKKKDEIFLFHMEPNFLTLNLSEFKFLSTINVEINIPL